MPASPPPSFVIRQTGDAAWESAEPLGLPGVLCRTYKDGIQGIIGTFPAGYVEPEHSHDELDHWCVILDGEMHVDGRVLRRGDYIYAPCGVRHGPFHYPVGCTIFANVRGGAFVHEFETPAGIAEPE